MKTTLLIVGLSAGSFLSLVNFYLSFIRYPLFLARGEKKEDYRWSSGIPLLGSGILVVSLVFAGSALWIWIPASIIALLDTGGIHWFIGSIVYNAIKKKSA